MIYQERLLKVLKSLYVSEKTSMISKKFSTFVFQVDRNANKVDVKNAVNMLFSVKVNDVNIVILREKNKSSRKNISGNNKIYCKKAYVILERGKKIDFSDKFKQ